MLISTLYLIIASQVALIMVFLIAYLIYMLVSEENRWEGYSKKLKSKIRDLLEYKDRFDIVSDNLKKQKESTKELSDKIQQFDEQLLIKDTKISELEFAIIDIESTKDSKISDQELLILEHQSTISELQNSIKELEENSGQSDASSQTIKELKTQLVLLEDQNIGNPDQLNDLKITIETLEAENKLLKTELSNANAKIIEDSPKGNKPTENKAPLDSSDTAKTQQMLVEANDEIKELENEINFLQGEISQLLQENQVLSSAKENTSNSAVNEDVDIDSIDDILFDVAKKP